MKALPSTDRSIWNSSSVPALSVQLWSIWPAESTVAVSPDGAAGAVCPVVAEATLDGPEQPESLHARTR